MRHQMVSTCTSFFCGTPCYGIAAALPCPWKMTPTSIEHILGVWEKLGPMERSILNTLAYRILAGQRTYGPLHEKKKDWTWEAAEESLDQAVYMACALVAFTEESKRKYVSNLDK